MTDVVERLREEAAGDWRSSDGGPSVVQAMLRESADEIERLRSRLAEAELAQRQADEACQKMHDSWGPLMARLTEAEALLLRCRGLVSAMDAYLAQLVPRTDGLGGPHPALADIDAFLERK